MSEHAPLRSSDKARLRDWYDTSGTWVVKMTALYALVERIAERAVTDRLTAVEEQLTKWERMPAGGPGEYREAARLIRRALDGEAA